ncbi:MAG TPA: N-acetylmuramoyl-L-alanine amidase [Kofleriaceae bacterium]|jgi:hypothetical protein
MSTWKPSGNVYIAGQKFHIDAPVINWTEGPRWDATSLECIPTQTDPTPGCVGGFPHGPPPLTYNRRYALRPALRSFGDKMPPLEAAKAVIKQFVIHHDGCSSADMCFSVLQNERGLSVHFLLDNDGTIFQTIDLALMAYHAADWNIASIGIELCNRGDALKEPHYYDSAKYKRDTIFCKVNGHTIKSFGYTAEQKKSFVQLCRELRKLLPNLPSEFPQSSPGVQSWETLPRSASFAFSGYIGHYHLTEQKWDPGPFDFKDFCAQLRGSLCFPVFAKADPKRTDKDRPEVPQKVDDLAAATQDLYKANEQRADGGFFPVGPWGESRLWHGGVHLVGSPGDPVVAPFPGRLVAARMGKTSAIGSVNFVLLRHDMALGQAHVQFYSLYMHLADELTATPPVDWMTKDGWKKSPAPPGEVVLLDEPLEAGAIIGHVGTAGPPEASKAQTHVEIFSTNELFTSLPASPWQLVDGTAGGRFCDSPEVDDAIDANHDGLLDKQELSQFYLGGGGSAMHFLVTLHVSEWTPEPSWADALRVPKDFKKWKASDLDQLVADQLTPGLWWDAATSQHAKLPPDGIVYHYHPITFVSWFNQQLLDAAASAPVQKIDETAAKQALAVGLSDDNLGETGSTMRSSADVSEDPCNQKLTLNELVQGFDAPECTP